MNEFKNAYDNAHINFSWEEVKLWEKIRGCAELGLFVVYGKFEAFCPTTDGSFGLGTTFDKAVANRIAAESAVAKLNEAFGEQFSHEISGTGYYVFGPLELEAEKNPPLPPVEIDLDGEKRMEDARDVEAEWRKAEPGDDIPF